GFGIVRPEVESLAVTRDRIVQPGAANQGIAESIERVGVVRFDSESFADQIDSEVEASRLKGGDSKRMQAVGMVRFDGEDLAVAMLGFDQSSGLMMLAGGKHVLDARA
ncbi:MAG: hypothetical protein QOG78_4737, partial [Rhodospirillaceae bacterium]|nr:hypothetical protein [Rhodospirillaceae bacterium]